MTEFHFNYITSLKSFNQKGEKNLAYVCVVEDNHLNLTPLGKVVMPPPLFEKQIQLESFPVHVDMFGHDLAAMTQEGKVILTNCNDINQKTELVLKTKEGSVIFPFDVSKMVIYRAS